MREKTPKDINQIEQLRLLKPHHRIKIAFELYDFARSRVAAQLKRDNPNMTRIELLQELNKRFVGITT